MKSILQACRPRPDLLKGTFNPEIFTASLGAVIRFYREGESGIHSVYTDAEEFFTEATYPSIGLKTVLSDVFGRLAGDNTVPAIHRLETAFGGGKTHTLIACAHIGVKGNKLSNVIGGLIDAAILPRPSEICVVGVSGDKIPVLKPRGEQLIPYTLWGEIAFQIGGEALYKEVSDEAESFAAPGENFLTRVLGGRKVLIMIDELAQYAARFLAARPDARQQLEAFLLTLHGFARENPGIAIIETLASAKDAFASQTKMLAELLSEVTGKEIDADTALGIGQQAVEGLTSVVSRDATSVVPVQAAEISRILAKRLFVSIDTRAAEDTAAEYQAMYEKNSSLLPDEATRADYKDRLVSHYPFHPTLINFLNNKLAAYENFQGTRGVLRVLALAVRSIWENKVNLPMIHTCHINLRDARTVNEVIGRTGSSDLLAVLNADVGGADTGTMAGGRSNAELADSRNPHPEGYPLYEYTWKTVFLHSLVGREQGLGSNIFGLAEPDALFEVSFPGLTPPQVSEALKEIGNSAFYLRFNQGRYYASLDPSINIALAQIRRTLSGAEITEILDAFARKVISSDTKSFKVVHDVTLPEHIPESTGKPVIAIVALGAENIDIEEMITTAGTNRPRIAQNNVLILVPETVSVKTQRAGQEPLFNMRSEAAAQVRRNLEELARTVLAMRRLDKNPQAYGIQAQGLQRDDFKQRFREREKGLETLVTESYRHLWYPSARGQIAYREIRTAGGEGGIPVIEQIRHSLSEDGELIIPETITQEVLAGFRKLFFSGNESVKIAALRENFARLRSWPMLESAQVLEQLIRTGVAQGVWCLFRIGREDATQPDEFFSRDEAEVPLNLELKEDHAIVTPEGARQRGWSREKRLDPRRLSQWVQTVAYEMPEEKVAKIAEEVSNRFGEIDDRAFKDTVAKLVQERKLLAHKDKTDKDGKPELISGEKATFYLPEPDDVLLTPARAAEKGWISDQDKRLVLSGREGAAAIIPLLRRIGSIYQRGGKSRIDLLHVTDLGLPSGGFLSISLTDLSPDTLKDAGELFEVVDTLAQPGDKTEVFLEINDPQQDCPFVQELQRILSEGKK
ncbi:MAG: DUF499 domain-containing protein [Deltaproteobacteria bacterium]|nr:DUF499 domain-containing protein [Deltaproteobacteria bacterium]